MSAQLSEIVELLAAAKSEADREATQGALAAYIERAFDQNSITSAFERRIALGVDALLEFENIDPTRAKTIDEKRAAVLAKEAIEEYPELKKLLTASV